MTNDERRRKSEWRMTNGHSPRHGEVWPCTPVGAFFWPSDFGIHSSFVIRHSSFIISWHSRAHETLHVDHCFRPRLRPAATLRAASTHKISRGRPQISALRTVGLRADAAGHGLVSLESEPGKHLGVCGL